MELKDFIKTAISSIATGITEAQEELKDKNVIINPEHMETGSKGDKLLRADGWRYTQDLEFEILISIDDKKGTSSGAKLTVFNIANIGAKVKMEYIASNTNRLKFTLPVAFPTMKTPDSYQPKKSK